MRVPPVLQLALMAVLGSGVLVGCTHTHEEGPVPQDPISTHSLPEPLFGEAVGLDELLNERRSTRDFTTQPLSPQELSTLLWAGYGYRDDGGRVVPSAGGTYPMRLHVAIQLVDGLEPGFYAYDPQEGALALRVAGDLAPMIRAASLDQESITEAPATIIVTGTPDLLADRYGDRAKRFALIESGHIAQNIALAAAELRLGLVTIGAFDDEDLRDVLGLADDEKVYYVIPIGHPRE